MGTKVNSIRYDCTPCLTRPTAGYSLSYAYHMHVKVPTTINVCAKFWDESSVDKAAGIIVHALSHHGQVNDYIYGQKLSQGLALLSPRMSVNSPSNYKYFAANKPPLP
ncbi:unnamed protein product [Rhizoctonia solani]|uniref:Lysine-specific metallo-endopeptidase domain-containing protein n=1 Tax=Rhizoctonia solani TaxID=456999 RepID=A0A8H2WRB7_9AGAM|nr:unnamed protein product [Rhizoctonia solani]